MYSHLISWLKVVQATNQVPDQVVQALIPLGTAEKKYKNVHDRGTPGPGLGTCGPSHFQCKTGGIDPLVKAGHINHMSQGKDVCTTPI